MSDFDIESEWATFLEESEDITGGINRATRTNSYDEQIHIPLDESAIAPEPLPLYISTKSIITYLNTEVDINNIFWNLPILPYSTPHECVIKKEIKLTSLTREELDDINSKVDKIRNSEGFIPHIKENFIVPTIDNPNGRIKFKDVRKLSIGISKKDITSCRRKQKGAFYNCLVIIIRIKMPDETSFREMHVKIFNTGKIEIPGIQSDNIFQYVCNKIIEIIQPYLLHTISFIDSKPETVLINSNFNCRFYINRQKLFDILRTKYKIQCLYDSCYYPGIQCKFADINKNIKNVSFMIFRTGSVLIVGKCNESDIYEIYEYVKNILIEEYRNICQPMTIDNDNCSTTSISNKKKKTIRKRKVYVTDNSIVNQDPNNSDMIKTSSNKISTNITRKANNHNTSTNKNIIYDTELISTAIKEAETTAEKYIKEIAILP